MIRRGEIWWADLPEPVGSGPGFRRPVIIIQSDGFNQSRIATTIVVMVTTNEKLAQAPGNVLLPHKATGLPQDSVANVSQVLTIDRSLLTEYISALPAKLMAQVEEGLRLTLKL